ncbi:MAG TPA: hypothetical protein VK708_15235 [Bryobacteraceae bacterium]|nr:hypothetical protein [Bryobacteraceae bacterium]
MVRRLAFVSVAAGLAAASLLAQGPHRGGGPGDFAFVRAEFGGSNKVVQGAPYSAQAVTQFTQTLANGDHIQRNTTASIARDSQGRMRTERSFGNIGALSATRGSGKNVMIFDPVASKSYVLEPESKVARSMPIPAARLANSSPHMPHDLASAKTEDLGTQVIQGVSAQGKRVTRAIPAGKEGNEKEIDIVTETWYSPDLQVVVMSKTSDPRFGESVYQLNAITRTEPDPALFTVPSDYAIKEGRPFRQGEARRGPAPAQ